MYSRNGVKAMMLVTTTIKMIPTEPRVINKAKGDSFNENFSSNVSSFKITRRYLFFKRLNIVLWGSFCVSMLLQISNLFVRLHFLCSCYENVDLRLPYFLIPAMPLLNITIR